MPTLSVGKYPSGKGWRIIEETWKDNKRSFKTVPKEAYQALGINPRWTIDTAREEIKKLNARNSADRSTQKAIIGASLRVKKNKNSDLFPLAQLEEFEKMLEATNMGSEKHYQKKLIMWGTAQGVIGTINIEPGFYKQYCKAFYNQFIKAQYSPDYCLKLLGLINDWGALQSKRRGQYYEPIPNPIGQEKTRILRSYKMKGHNRFGGSESITPEMLESHKVQLGQESYEWLYCSVWFGLRPDEIETADFTVYHDKTYDVDVLRIFQPKVQTYKHIPILYPEQKLAIEYLRPMKRPLNKRIKKVFDSKKITVYGGRKGFEDLMTSRGEALTDVSKWLGHTTLKTTSDHYEKKDKVVLSRRAG